MRQYVIGICKHIATLGPVGYLPIQGTLGTLCALPLLFGFRKLQTWLGVLDEGVLLVAAIFLVVWIINQALKRIHTHDPDEIILDEVVGFMVTMAFFPLTFQTLFWGFFYFRLFDIVKPLGIQSLENIGGGWGIVLDDLAAAMFARFAMAITFRLLL